MAVVQTKSLQVPEIIYNEWVRAVLRIAAEVATAGDVNPAKKGYLFTERERLAMAVDSAYFSAEGKDQAGNKFTAELILINERPVLIHYLKTSETLLMEFWARKVSADGVLALPLGV